MLSKSDNVKALDFIIQIHSGQTRVISFSGLIACFLMYIVIDGNMCRPRLFPGFSSKSSKCLIILCLYVEACTDPVLSRYYSLGPPAFPFSSSSNTYIYLPYVAIPFIFVMF